MKKVFKIADIRDLDEKVSRGEISYSRMVEILNEMAEKSYLGNNLCCDCKEPLPDGFKNRCPKCYNEIYFPK